VSEAKQAMLKERQDKYLEELAMKHELQQQEGRYVKAPRYLHAASKEYANRRYREDAVETAVEMMQAGTIDQSARSVRIEQQVTQDWPTRRKLSKRWATIMKRTQTPLIMLWKTHVMGDAVVQTRLKAGKVFTKWARRMPNVPFLSSRGIPYEVTQAVLERTWKVVREQIGEGSALQGLKTKVWRSRNATQQCSSCGISVSDKGEPDVSEAQLSSMQGMAARA
jgi:hypothetical protein